MYPCSTLKNAAAKRVFIISPKSGAIFKSTGFNAESSSQLIASRWIIPKTTKQLNSKFFVIKNVTAESPQATPIRMTVLFHGFLENIPHIPDINTNPAAKNGSAGEKKVMSFPAKSRPKTSKQV